MNELIKITANEQGSDVVSARELHEFLEVKTRFNDWIKNRIIRYGFLQDTDYVTLTENLVSGGQETDYVITLDMAKELSMVERTPKGKEARQYFIDAEKTLRQIVASPPTLPVDQTVLQILAQQTQLLVNQQELSNRQQAQLNQLQSDVDRILNGKRLAAPTPSVADPELRKLVNRRVNEYCGLNGYLQSETYTYLYKRMQQVYGVDVWRLKKAIGDKILDAIERYGHLDKLYSLVCAELAYVEE